MIKRRIPWAHRRLALVYLWFARLLVEPWGDEKTDYTQQLLLKQIRELEEEIRGAK